MKEMIIDFYNSINRLLLLNSSYIEISGLIAVVICLALLIVAFIKSRAEDKKSIIMQMQKKQDDLTDSFYKDAIKNCHKNNTTESHINVMFGHSEYSMILFSVICVLLPLALSVLCIIFLPANLFFKIETVFSIFVVFRIFSGILYKYNRSKDRQTHISILYSIINTLKIKKGNIILSITECLQTFPEPYRVLMNNYLSDIANKSNKVAGYKLRAYSDDVFWIEMCDILTYALEYGNSPETALAALQSNLIFEEQNSKEKNAMEFVTRMVAVISVFTALAMVILYPLYHDAIGAKLGDGSLYLIFGLLIIQNALLLISCRKDDV